MVAVPAGGVRLSDRRTNTRWTVEVAPYLLAAVPVTTSWYAQVTGAETESGDDRPVVDVSWWDAVRFCNGLSERAGLPPAYRIDTAAMTVAWDETAHGYRLPTEAEWEYACRAGTTGPHYGRLDAIAWYDANAGDGRHPVGGKAANAWGLHDMLGNAWDWCWDLYDPVMYGEYRVLRGGGWADAHWSCRASVRRRSHPRLRLDDVGFRIARNASPGGHAG